MVLGSSFRILVISFLVSLTSSPAQTKYVPLETTFWATSDADGSPAVLQFEKTGKFSYIPVTGVVSKGKWKQQEKTILMEVNGGFVAFRGIVEGDRMEGTASTKKGVRWNWVATKQPVVLATATINYPPLAVAARVEGSVIVEVDITKAGDVAAIRSINRAHPLLKKVVEDAAKNWRFQPAEEDLRRTARLSFTFHILDNRGKKVISPLALSPYQLIISRQPDIIDKQYSHTST